jgi:hypothetical protein
VPDPVPPELRPLPFDHGAAAAAIDECRRAAVRIEDVRVHRSSCAAWARVEWRGPARDGLDAELAGIDAAGAELRSRLLHLAGSIAATRDEVDARNRSRAEARDAWLAEQAAARAGAGATAGG